MATQPKAPPETPRVKPSWKTGEGQSYFLRNGLGIVALGFLFYSKFIDGNGMNLDVLLSHAKTGQQFADIIQAYYQPGVDFDWLGAVTAVLTFMGFDVKQFVGSRTAIKKKELEK